MTLSIYDYSISSNISMYASFSSSPRSIESITKDEPTAGAMVATPYEETNNIYNYIMQDECCSHLISLALSMLD